MEIYMGAKLLIIDETQYSDLESDFIESINGVLLYFAYDGRNAWRSTSVTRYMAGAININLLSAKEHCEDRRVQGSTFIINQIPGLHIFTNGKKHIFITQINCKSPLAGYSKYATQSFESKYNRVGVNVADLYLKVGGNALGACLSFAPSSRFWSQSPPTNNSIKITIGCDIDMETEKISCKKLKSWHSLSYGPNYHLGWSEHKSQISPASVLGLLED